MRRIFFAAVLLLAMGACQGQKCPAYSYKYKKPVYKPTFLKDHGKQDHY